MPRDKATSPPRAVLFDLDGTLYDQRPLRRRMVWELARAPLRGPLRAARDVKRLKAFRRMREDLRALGADSPSLDRTQFERPAEALGDSAEAMERTVVDWMFERPLRHLGPCGWPGLAETLSSIASRGVRLGVFSDYPPAEKLTALGVGHLFDVALAATDAEVNAFKPHPRGFELGAQRLGFEPSEVTYVGDRIDVDATGAAASGMDCVLLAPRGLDATHPVEGDPPPFVSVSDFRELPHALGLA